MNPGENAGYDNVWGVSFVLSNYISKFVEEGFGSAMLDVVCPCVNYEQGFLVGVTDYVIKHVMNVGKPCPGKAM